MSDFLFVCSHCKLSKNRIFYVVWKWDELFAENRKPVAFGYTATTEEADGCMAQIVQCPKEQICRQGGFAISYHRELAEEKRRRCAPSGEHGSAAVEFVYEASYSNEGGELCAIPHRIIRRTRHRVFINVCPYYHDKGIDLPGGIGAEPLSCIAE
jgi:hypothetical protein